VSISRYLTKATRLIQFESIISGLLLSCGNPINEKILYGIILQKFHLVSKKKKNVYTLKHHVYKLSRNVTSEFEKYRYVSYFMHMYRRIIIYYLNI